VIWCEGHLTEQRQKRENISFEKYVEGFWLPSGVYAQGKTSRGFTISLNYLKIAEIYTRIHVVPLFGSSRLRDITTRRIDSLPSHSLLKTLPPLVGAVPLRSPRS
jgi:hypothetical protein